MAENKEAVRQRLLAEVQAAMEEMLSTEEMLSEEVIAGLQRGRSAWQPSKARRWRWVGRQRNG